MRLYDFKGPGDQLLVSLDYDNTYTADPKGMRALIRCLQSSGHKVIIVTMRSRELDWDAEFSFLKSDYGIETFFADGQPKRKYMEDRGIYVDIWIDDSPEGIVNGSSHTPEELQQWRKENGLKVA